MTEKGQKAFFPFFIWLALGFLVGLTGSVIASPYYFPEVAMEAQLVYAPGLQPQSQIEATETDSGGNTEVVRKDEEIFLQKGCTQCHEVGYYGMAGGVTGPDLSIAYGDVPSRFGKTLEEFLWEPEGTMAEMFARMDITDEEKTLIHDLLVKASGDGNNS